MTERQNNQFGDLTGTDASICDNRSIAMDDFFVLVTLYARAGREEELRTKLIPLAEASRRDEGNLRYEFFVDQGDPRRFIFMEHWDSPESQHKHHTQSEHVRRFEGQKSALVEKIEVFLQMKEIG
jgi:quinol monooxygenase YgiN